MLFGLNLGLIESNDIHQSITFHVHFRSDLVNAEIQVFRDGARCFAGDTSVPIINNDQIEGYCSSYNPRITLIFSVSGFIAGIFQV